MKKLVLLALFLSFYYCLNAKDKITLPDSVIGVWEGKASLLLPLAHQAAPSPNDEDNPLVSILIKADGTVKGQVGSAIMKNCIAKKNRSWLGRLLNLRTDYMITNGYLEGFLSGKDSVQFKKFSLPFNTTDNKMKGSVMRIYRLKYPYPLVRVIIPKKAD